MEAYFKAMRPKKTVPTEVLHTRGELLRFGFEKAEFGCSLQRSEPEKAHAQCQNQSSLINCH